MDDYGDGFEGDGGGFIVQSTAAGAPSASSSGASFDRSASGRPPSGRSTSAGSSAAAASSPPHANTAPERSAASASPASEGKPSLRLSMDYLPHRLVPAADGSQGALSHVGDGGPGGGGPVGARPRERTPPPARPTDGPSGLSMRHMQQGVDERGVRIRMFTAAVTCGRAVKAGLAQFKYDGEAVEAVESPRTSRRSAKASMSSEGVAGKRAAPAKKYVGLDRERLDKLGLVRHGYGTIHYHSGNRYSGEWEHDRRSGFGTFECAPPPPQPLATMAHTPSTASSTAAAS